ncbi:hypothetical protein DDP54_12180 [Cellulomonas sp. WB94]|nr:hypothetical protein DDP54_12180 [Cellulomonas sp. WB94]
MASTRRSTPRRHPTVGGNGSVDHGCGRGTVDGGRAADTVDDGPGGGPPVAAGLATARVRPVRLETMALGDVRRWKTVTRCMTRMTTPLAAPREHSTSYHRAPVRATRVDRLCVRSTERLLGSASARLCPVR